MEELSAGQPWERRVWGSSPGADLKPPAHVSLVLSEEDEGLLAWSQTTQVDS